MLSCRHQEKNIDLVLAHSFPLDIVFLSCHFLPTSLSLYPSPRALFASNTYMHVYRSISLNINWTTVTIEKKQGRDSLWYPYIKELDRQRGRGQLAVESPLLWIESELDYLNGSPMRVSVCIY